MDDIDVLESVVGKTAGLIGKVRTEQRGETTPTCPKYDVGTLVNHVVGWARSFAAGANGETYDGEPDAYDGADPAADYSAAADDLIRGWRAGGTDRMVRFGSQEMPGEGVLAMTLMEETTHGLDLALATGQPVPYSDEELELTLARAKVTLPDEYRGEGMPFAAVVPVPDDAPAVDRLLGFMGRQPA
jgi:uncharacterized protein (TIGR03086 family)